MCRRKAFTLIELLVVISIVMLLMAIFVPVLHKARKQARAAGCQMHLRQWGTTLATIAEDKDGQYGSPLWILAGWTIEEKTTGQMQAPQYHPIGTKGMLCPETRRNPYASAPIGGLYAILSGNTNRAWALVDHRDPTEKPRVISVSYGLNGWQFPETPRARDGGSQGPSHANVFTMRHTARIPLLLDCTHPASSPTEEGPPPGGATGTGTGGMRPFCVNRHSGYVNCLFLDWSVRKVGLKELWTLKWHKDFNTGGPWTRAGGVEPSDWPEWMRGFEGY